MQNELILHYYNSRNSETMLRWPNGKALLSGKAFSRCGKDCEFESRPLCCFDHLFLLFLVVYFCNLQTYLAFEDSC
jgi:hypothetical protein